MPRILIADDHGLYRKGLRIILETALPKLEFFEAGSFEAALTELEAGDALDLVLIDLYMPGLASFDSLREARERCPRTLFLMISSSDAKADVLSCLAAGLHGFVSKLEPDDEIVAAVNHVLSGGIYVPRWLAQVDVISSPPFGPGLPPALSDQAPLAKLTPRQRDVLPLLAQGMSNKEIARALKIAEATTKIHVAAVRRVLDVRNRTEAALAGRTLLDEQNVGGGSHRTGSRQGGSVSRMDPVADHVGLAAAGSANG